MFKVSALSACTHFESCMPLVNVWRQWHVVQCCTKRLAGDDTKFTSNDVRSTQKKIIKLKVNPSNKNTFKFMTLKRN